MHAYVTSSLPRQVWFKLVVCGFLSNEQLHLNLNIWGVKKYLNPAWLNTNIKQGHCIWSETTEKTCHVPRSTYTNRVDIFLDFLNLSLIFPWDIKATSWRPGGVGGRKGLSLVDEEGIGSNRNRKTENNPNAPLVDLSGVWCQKTSPASVD